MLSEISRNNANSSPLPQNHWKTGKPSGNFNMTKYDENITKVLTYIYGDDLSLNQSDFENPDWNMKVIGPNDGNSNWTFIHSMYYIKLFMMSHIILFYQFLPATENDRTVITEIFPINQNFERYNDHTYFCTQPKPNVIQVDNFQKVRFVYTLSKNLNRNFT